MKSESPLRCFLSIVVSALLLATQSHSATLYWDGGSVDILTDGNGASTSAAGTWNTSLLNWDAGAVPHVAWSSGDYAVIAVSANTVTVGSGIVTSGIDFIANGTTLDATSSGLGFTSGSNQLRLAGNNWAATINGSISGSGDMNIQAIHTGTLGFNPTPIINFGGTSTGGWTGATTITRGVSVNLTDDNQALKSTSGITLNGGMIRLTNTTANAIKNDRINDSAAITINGGGGIRIANTAGAGLVYNEDIGAVTFNSGYSKFTFTTNQNGGSGNSQTLTLAGLTRNGYSVASFAAATTTQIIKVTGATQTAAGEIIGAWAISGNGNTDDDYAVYNASGQIANRAATANNTETSWSTAWSTTANQNTTTANISLSADRAFNTFRIGTGASAWSIGDFKFATYGLLLAAGNQTINAGTGFITIPTANGNSALYLVGGNSNGSTINAPIRDNGSAKLTLVLGGGNGSSLTLNGDSNYTGGTVIARSQVVNSATSGTGNLTIGHANAFGASTNFLKFESGILNLSTFNVTVGEFSGEASSYISAGAGGTLTVGTGTSSTSSTEFKGLITGGQIVKNGDGRLVLSGINTASATTAQYTVNGGTLQFAKAQSFHNNTAASWTAAKNVVNSGGTLAFNVGGTDEFTSGNVTTILTNLGGLGGSVASGAGLQAGSKIAFDTTNAAGGTFTIANNIADSTGAGGGAIGLTKLGTGTLELSGTNTYTGATTVAAGKLLVNGSTAAGSTVNVASGATLGGSGAISGAVNVSGQLSAGNSIETLGMGTLSMVNSSTLVHELDSSVSTALGSDLLKVTGNLNFTGTVNLSLTDLAATDVAFAVNDIFSLINYTGTWNAGLLTFSGNELADEEVFTFGLNTWKISYDDATGGLNYTGEYAGGADSFVNITALSIIPEPSAALLGCLGVLLILRRRR